MKSKIKEIAGKLTPYRVARLTGLSYSTVYAIFKESEIGEARPLHTYVRIAKALGVRVTDLFGEER